MGVGGGWVVNRDISRYIQRSIVGNPQFRKYRDAQKAPWYFLGPCVNVGVLSCW